MHSHPSDRRIAPRSTLPRLIALILALGATGTSAWISIVAGIERGGTSAERAAWAAVALVVLLVAHPLPALTRGESLQIKLPALALWGVPCRHRLRSRNILPGRPATRWCATCRRRRARTTRRTAAS